MDSTPVEASFRETVNIPIATRVALAADRSGLTELSEPSTTCLVATGLNAYFGARHAVRNVALDLGARSVTAIIGPSGCGKSTLLRCLNRMHETVAGARVTGSVTLDGEPLYGDGTSAIAVRRHIGMVFQRPTPFPTMSTTKLAKKLESADTSPSTRSISSPGW